MNVRKTVSHSEVDSFLTCPRKHYYNYGLEITRRRVSDALAIGKFGHEALDVFFTYRLEVKDDFEEAKAACFKFVGEQMMLRPLDSEIINTALKAIQFFFEAGGLMEYEILAVEKEFVLQISEDLEMPFIPDIICRDRSTGLMGVFDNKFTGRFYTDMDMELMPQLPKYLGGLRALGYEIYWVGFNILRTGGAKADTYKERHRLEIMDVSDARIRNTFTEQYKASLKIIEIKQKAAANPESGMYEWSQDALRVQNTMICSRCSFHRLCVAELNEDSPDLVLDSEYMKKTRREFKDSTNGQ